MSLAKSVYDTGQNDPSKIRNLLLCSFPDFAMQMTHNKIHTYSPDNLLYKPVQNLLRKLLRNKPAPGGGVGMSESSSPSIAAKSQARAATLWSEQS